MGGSYSGTMGNVTAVVTDLFFQAKINAAGRAAGRPVRFVPPGAIPTDLGEGEIVLIDLDARGDVLGAILAASAAGAHVIAFGPHVDTAGRKAAREAGAKRVLAKSKFVTELPRIMGGSQPADAAAES